MTIASDHCFVSPENDFNTIMAMGKYLMPYLAIEKEFNFHAKNRTILTPNQEKIGFIALNYIKFKVNQSVNTESHVHWHNFFIKIRNVLVCSNLKLVHRIIRYRKLSMNDNRYWSEGSFALMKAVEAFDPWRNIKFSTYGCRSILNIFSKINRSGHVHFVDQGELEQVQGQTSDISTVETDSKLASIIRSIVLTNDSSVLDKREKIIISARYGFMDKKYKLEEIGSSLDLTAERIRQIQIGALEKIKKHILKKHSSLI